MSALVAGFLNQEGIQTAIMSKQMETHCFKEHGNCKLETELADQGHLGLLVGFCQSF